MYTRRTWKEEGKENESFRRDNWLANMEALQSVVSHYSGSGLHTCSTDDLSNISDFSWCKWESILVFLTPNIRHMSHVNTIWLWIQRILIKISDLSKMEVYSLLRELLKYQIFGQVAASGFPSCPWACSQWRVAAASACLHRPIYYIQICSLW